MYFLDIFGRVARVLRLSFLKHFRLSGKLVTAGPFRGLATRDAGTSLASFGRLFHSPSEGRARARGASKKINVQIVCSEVEKRKVNNFVKLHPTYNVFLSI